MLDMPRSDTPGDKPSRLRKEASVEMRYTQDGPVDNGPGGGHVPQLVMLQVSIFPLFFLCIARASTASLADIDPRRVCRFDGKPGLLAELAEAWGWAVC